MKLLIVLILISITTTAYAVTPFEQAYKNAKTSTQKIKVLFAEIKAKNIVIQEKETIIKQKDADIEQLKNSDSRESQDLYDTVRMLRQSNEDKDREIQRIASQKVQIQTIQVLQPQIAAQTINPIISKPMKAILTTEINGVTTNLEIDLTPVMTGEQDARDMAMLRIFETLQRNIVKDVLNASK